MTRLKTLTRSALVLLGLLVVGLLLWKAGWPAIRANMAAIGGWFAVLLLLYLPVQLAFTAGWWALLPAWPVTFRQLFAAYLAGDAVNYVSPGGVVGEPVKMHLLQPALPPRESAPTLVLHKHAEVFSQAVFVMAGVIATLALFPLPPSARLAALGGAFFLGGLLWLMTWGLLRGSFGPIVASLARLPLLSPLAKLRGPAEELDRELQRFYQHAAGRRRFFISSAWCLLGWSLRTVETYVVLKLFSPASGWALAFSVEAVSMALNNAFIWVPGRVGSAEGVRTGVCVLLGLSTAQGVSYGLVRRAREVLWAVPGMLVLARRHVRWPGGDAWRALGGDEKANGLDGPPDSPDRLAFQGGAGK